MKLTQEQLAELIAKVFANIDEKRKARKEGGEDLPESISTEEIIAEVGAILEGMGEPVGEGEPEAEKDCGSAVSPEFIAKVIEALGGVKSVEPAAEPAADTGAGEKKFGGPSATIERKSEPQRKYAGLFISTGASRDGDMTSGFKGRMASMSAPERRKTAFGMFGRAVKCIHASGGDVEKAAFTAERKFNDTEMAAHR